MFNKSNVPWYGMDDAGKITCPDNESRQQTGEDSDIVLNTGNYTDKNTF